MSRLPTRAPARKAVASARAASVLSHLRKLYSLPAWALFTEVRNATGCCETIRTADALAVHLYPSHRPDGVRIHGIEVKASRSDWLRERRTPEKSGPLKAFCAAWYLVTPAPWKNVVLHVSELPEGWGLIEAGTGHPTVIVRAEERDAEVPTPSFLRALLRAAARDAEQLTGEEPYDVPRVVITRPNLTRTTVGLACGHVAPRPLCKVMPKSAPCFGCKDGRASDRAYIEAALEEATAEDLADYLNIIERRRALRAA